MSFGHSALRGFPVTGTGGRVEYRLARNAVVSEFHKGRLSKLDVCDAHPELLRAARNVGVPLAEECPICEGPPSSTSPMSSGPASPPTAAARRRPPSSPACAGGPTRSPVTSSRCAPTVPGTTWPGCTRPVAATGRALRSAAGKTARRGSTIGGETPSTRKRRTPGYLRMVTG